MLRAAGRRLDRVFEDRDNKAHENGVSELLVVGVASWSGNHVPVLTYPVRVIRDSGKDETYATIYFSGNVRLNHALVLRLQERGVNLSEDALFDGANYESGTPETSAVLMQFVHLLAACSQILILNEILFLDVLLIRDPDFWLKALRFCRRLKLGMLETL